MAVGLSVFLLGNCLLYSVSLEKFPPVLRWVPCLIGAARWAWKGLCFSRVSVSSPKSPSFLRLSEYLLASRLSPCFCGYCWRYSVSSRKPPSVLRLLTGLRGAGRSPWSAWCCRLVSVSPMLWSPSGFKVSECLFAVRLPAAFSGYCCLYSVSSWNSPPGARLAPCR